MKNTKDLINIYTTTILNLFSDKLPITFDFDEWNTSYFRHKIDIDKEIFFEKEKSIEIKNDALKKVMNNIFIHNASKEKINKWDKDYVRKKYGRKLHGCDVIYYPSKNPKRIVFNFSSMGKDRYDRYSRYWDITESWENDTAYVFFKDDNYTFYLGDDSSPLTGTYFKLIKFFIEINNLTTENAYTVGGSMGGFAALYYGIQLKVAGCIVCNPQINLRSTLAHEYRNWTKHILNTGHQWCDIDLLPYRYDRIPDIYIEYGNYPADELAVNDLIKSIRNRKSLLLTRKASWNNHTVDTVLTKMTVDNTIWYFENNGFID